MSRRWIGSVALIAGLLVALFLVFRTPDTDAAAMRAKYGGPASRFIDISPGFTVHVRDQGRQDAPALILIHGSNASLHTWEPWVARLKDRYRLISLDLQGHGLTGPIPSGCYTSACMAETVEAVRAKLGVERAAIAGNSMGGGVALAYALAHPDRTTALILVDSGGVPPVANAPEPDLPLGFRIARMPMLRDLAASITPRALVERSLQQSVSVQSVVTPAAVDRYWDLLRYPGNRAATMVRFSQPRTTITDATYAPLKMPVLILWGKEDRLIPVASVAAFQRALPEAKAIIYSGIGHIPQEETPDRSAADVDSFLRGKPALTAQPAPAA
ncbi:alpha/beta fold hydrolase [Sandaracinobacteroides saxicola]|uniref:Alpha/beta hydrolase n=1 Tax=Sandaracinobacteroides saxicola TaxID=2759707 RepID=A0A7G5IL62_9SPHN|nr:alpha/beta hydrolase [Sandaracinobacteroides saxicola]QMW24104.1 alpha/beta hydrolase [Sandaracinobacteroides saxicola]